MAAATEQLKPLAELLEDLSCSVCFEERELLLLPCQHRYCKECIDKLRSPSDEICCPDCRQNFHYPDKGFPVCRLARAVREHIEQHINKSVSKEEPEQSTVISTPENLPPPAISEEALCQVCEKMVNARCCICRQFLCYRCLAKSECLKASGDTRHEFEDIEYVIEEANNVLSTWRYNVDKELSEIKNKRKRRDNAAIVEATIDAIDVQINPIERILMIEHITKTMVTGKTLRPDNGETKPKATEASEVTLRKQSVVSSEEQSGQKLSEAIEQRLNMSTCQRRTSKQRTKKSGTGPPNTLMVFSNQATALYSFDKGDREQCTNMVEGEIVMVIPEPASAAEGWAKIINSNGDSGLVPTSYLNISSSSTADTPVSPMTPLNEAIGVESIGTKFALYSFSKNNIPGCIDMVESEEVQVMEEHGDGWTIVINSRGEKGNVPTSYLSKLL